MSTRRKGEQTPPHLLHPFALLEMDFSRVNRALVGNWVESSRWKRASPPVNRRARVGGRADDRTGGGRWSAGREEGGGGGGTEA